MGRKEMYPEEDRSAAVDAREPVQGRLDGQTRIVLEVLRRTAKTRSKIIALRQR